MSVFYEPCGGCGAETPSERCFGCLHDFGPGLTAPSNANTSGLEVVAYLEVSNAGMGRRACLHQRKDTPTMLRRWSSEPLVTAASAQARIAALERRLEGTANGWKMAAAAHDEQEARADRLAKFGQHTNWELSFCYLDGEEEDGCWAVHSVNGGRNDREWTVIGRGETPDDAIRAALQQETQP